MSGQLRLPDGTPAAGVRVGAMAVRQGQQEGDVTLMESMAETDRNGRYRLTDVAPGRYYIVAGVLAEPTYHPGTANPGSATILTIQPGSNAAGVNFTIPRMPPPPSSPVPVVLPPVTGKVMTEEGDPPPFFLGTLYVKPSGGLPRTRYGEDGGKIHTSGAIPVGRNGAFSLPLKDGEYSISLINTLGDPLSSSDGYYVKSMTFGTADIMGRKFRVAGSSRPSITITLAKQPAN